MTLASTDMVSKKWKQDKPDLQGDRFNIILLIYMYILQFIPRGVSLAIPLILQNRKATYADQAGFSFVSYAFCFKLLWAPIVDCVYSKKIGRRKTWAIPTMYIIGIFLFLMSRKIDEWLGSEDGSQKPQIGVLGVVIFLCIFLSSTQDIAVDGWCMTMLHKRNVGYAGMCNYTGYAAGTFLSCVLFIVLDSKEFCNKFRSVPKDYGFVTVSDFLLYWSIIFIVSTTLILILKKENRSDIVTDDSECRLGLKESYKLLWKILNIPVVQKFCIILLTFQMGLGVVQGVVKLKLMDVGVPRDKFIMLTAPSIPFVVILPFLLGRYLTGKWSMKTFLAAYKFRLFIGIAYGILLFTSSYARDENGMFGFWYYWSLLIIYNLDYVVESIVALSLGAYLTQVSDARYGGIYVTLFTSAGNIGNRWPVSVCLWAMDFLTIKSCVEDGLTKAHTCKVVFDGFYTETVLCTLIGILWIFWGQRQIRKLENMDPSKWIVAEKPSSREKELLTF